MKSTCADVHDVVQRVFALYDVHHQLGESHVVLSHQGVHRHRLHHVVHQEEALGVLQAALRQVLVGAVIVQDPALPIREDVIYG